MTASPPLTRMTCGAWMRAHLWEYVDAITGEVDCTGMATGAAEAFAHAEEGGPLDDETHWIWEVAAIVADIPLRMAP